MEMNGKEHGNYYNGFYKEGSLPSFLANRIMPHITPKNEVVQKGPGV